MKDNTFLAGSILAAALIIAGSLIYVFGPEKSATSPGSSLNVTLPPLETNLPYSQSLTADGEVLLGDSNAPVEIIEYGDYQCPFCTRFFLQTENQIRKHYLASGRVKMIYRDLIIVDNFVAGGHESFDAALAANCAADQNKFWEYHDALFLVESADNRENNGNLNKALFMAIAGKLGLNESAFENCYDTRKYASKINADGEKAKKDLPELSTPAFLVNGEAVRGALPYENFAQIIDKHLPKQ